MSTYRVLSFQAAQKKREGMRSSQDLSLEYSTPIGGRRPASLSKSVGNVEHLDDSFRFVSRIIGSESVVILVLFLC